MPGDAFQLLGLPRAAALNEDEVRTAFQKAAGAVHPDGAANDGERKERTALFTALNEASAVVSSVPRRLKHLLELEYPELAAQKAGAPMDAATMDLFSLTAAAVQRAGAVQAKKRTATTALARALLAPEEMQAQEQLEEAAQKVEAARAMLEAELTKVDAARRGTGAPDAGVRLQAAAARAGFLEKWQGQIRAAFTGFLGE